MLVGVRQQWRYFIAVQQLCSSGHDEQSMTSYSYITSSIVVIMRQVSERYIFSADFFDCHGGIHGIYLSEIGFF